MVVGVSTRGSKDEVEKCHVGKSLPRGLPDYCFTICDGPWKQFLDGDRHLVKDFKCSGRQADSLAEEVDGLRIRRPLHYLRSKASGSQ